MRDAQSADQSVDIGHCAASQLVATGVDAGICALDLAFAFHLQKGFDIGTFLGDTRGGVLRKFREEHAAVSKTPFCSLGRVVVRFDPDLAH